MSGGNDQDGTAGGDAQAWKRALLRLRAQVGEANFSAWFGRLELDFVRDGKAHLSVPTRFLKSWIDNHFGVSLLETIRLEFGEVDSLTIVVRSSARAVGQAPEAKPSITGRPNDQALAPGAAVQSRDITTGSSANGPAVMQELLLRPGASLDNDKLRAPTLDQRLTFATFVVGRSNQLAHAAAERVAHARPGETAIYNPLYIHSAVGLGKTHLLQAIAVAASESGRRVIYLTAEKFMYRFVSALKAQTAIAFKEKLRGIDVLVIDDVQFLQGTNIQNEFCHTLSALSEAGKQIVVAADRPPADLESLDERVRSRLSGGLCVEIGALEEPLRVKILEARIAATRKLQPGFVVPQDVVAFVAGAVDTNGRDLEGAVNRLLARATLTGSALTAETAEEALRDLVRTHEPKRVRIEDIQKLVANHFQVSRSDLLSSRRTATVVRPRQIAMFLSKVLTLRSLPEIGRRFGGRDHTTVLHAVRKIEGLSAKDESLSRDIEILKRMLLE